MDKNFISRAFLLFLVVFIIYACYRIFQPYLPIIIGAAILVSIFYRPYEWLVSKFKGRRNAASLVMCLAIILIVIIPLANFLVYAAQQSGVAYNRIAESVDLADIDSFLGERFAEKLEFLGITEAKIADFVKDAAAKLSDWLIGGTTAFIKGTTSVIFSIVFMLITMFFFFVDGKKIVERVMHWTPLPNKYDKEIFQKFRDVSFSVLTSNFLTAIIQGTVGAVGFMIVGLPALFAGVAMAFLSLVPFVGTPFVWFPAGVYLLLTGKIWQGIFLLAWGGVLVANIDNVIRPYFIKGKAQVHPIFIMFSILGGIALFGFWGIIFGPLIISLAVTILHIYEMEYETVLEK